MAIYDISMQQLKKLTYYQNPTNFSNTTDNQLLHLERKWSLCNTFCILMICIWVCALVIPCKFENWIIIKRVVKQNNKPWYDLCLWAMIINLMKMKYHFLDNVIVVGSYRQLTIFSFGGQGIFDMDWLNAMSQERHKYSCQQFNFLNNL